MRDGEKILVRGVNWLGDAVMTTPALQRLREAKPDAHIILLTHEKLADLWCEHPSIDATLKFSPAENVFDVARLLRSKQFDSAVVFPNSPRSALEVFLARIPQRIGYGRNWRRFLFTQALPPRAGALAMHKRSRTEIEQRIERNASRETFPASAHHIHDYLNLVSALGANPAPLPPLLCVSDKEVALVRQRFSWNDHKPVFALNPGAEYGAAKRWPAERFIEAAIRLHNETQCRWLITGGRADGELAEGIANQIATRISSACVTNAAGKTSLRELCALLKLCALMLTNDTGPMHVAAALGTPVIVPFGSTSPELTAPAFGASSLHKFITGEAPCAPCFLRECPIDFRCMKSITVKQVVADALHAWRRDAQ